MASYVCPLCDARITNADPPVTCAACEAAYGRAITCVLEADAPIEHAIATPADAAAARVATVVDGGFAEGLPEMPAPAPLPDNVDRRPHGFSAWVLVLGIVAVVAMLIALTIPAVQKVRSASARTSSINNLKSIALASHGFHDANKRLPFNGAKPAIGGDNTSGSWAFMMLPFLDEKAMFDNVDRTRGLPVLMCPGRGRPQMCVDANNTGAWSDYCINPFLNSNVGQADAPDGKLTLVGITDGSSNTIFFGHGRLQPAHYEIDAVANGFSDVIFDGGSKGTCRGNTNVVLKQDGSDAQPGEWGGPFGQGCLMAMGDATVRMFPYSYEFPGTIVNGTCRDRKLEDHSFGAIPLFAASLTPNGEEFVTLPDS